MISKLIKIGIVKFLIERRKIKNYYTKLRNEILSAKLE